MTASYSQTSENSDGSTNRSGAVSIGHLSPGCGPYDDPQILAAMAELVEVGGKSLSCPDRSPAADLAVIIDERSFLERTKAPQESNPRGLRFGRSGCCCATQRPTLCLTDPQLELWIAVGMITMLPFWDSS
jgi:hypothetical protein